MEDGAEDAPAAVAPAYAAPAYAPPSYSGPTPADPFGGAAAFDIFDAIEQAEQQRALAAFAPQGQAAPVQDSTTGQAPLPPAADDAAETRLGSSQVIDEMPLTEPVIVLPEMVSVEEPEAMTAPAAPKPADAELVAPEALAPGSTAARDDAAEAAVTETPASEPAARESAAAPEPAPELVPAIVPILVGAAEPAEKKRGWWRK